jgi:hypothetical protein
VAKALKVLKFVNGAYEDRVGSRVIVRIDIPGRDGDLTYRVCHVFGREGRNFSEPGFPRFTERLKALLNSVKFRGLRQCPARVAAQLEPVRASRKLIFEITVASTQRFKLILQGDDRSTPCGR